MEYRIDTLPTTWLIGMCKTMTFADNQTAKLWQSFMPRRAEIAQVVSTHLFSVEIYPHTQFFQSFNPNTSFQKWACIETAQLLDIPEGMQSLVIPEGLYVVFQYIGLPQDGERAYRYIFQEWLPQSGYRLDDRPHIALMDDKYKQNDPSSEEELWIPIVTSNIIPDLDNERN